MIFFDYPNYSSLIPPEANYRFMLMARLSISSDVLIPLEFASYARWAVIIFTTSLTTLTLLLSRNP